jgi:hypothetical protein
VGIIELRMVVVSSDAVTSLLGELTIIKSLEASVTCSVSALKLSH